MTYAWIITKDNISPEIGAPTQKCVVGPRNADKSLIDLLKAGKGEKFRLLDDDGEVYYYARIVGDYTGFEPLDDFGEPNAGCTSVQYKNGDQWQTL